MKTEKTLIVPTVLCAALVFSLGACHKTEMPQSGSNDSNVVGQANEKMADAGENVKDRLGEMKDKTGAAVDDATITATVRSQIVKDPDLSNLDISVDTKAGIVTLDGTTKSAIARDRAVQIARAVEGVTDVQNRLTVAAQG